MNINVTKTQVSITNDYILNDKEYNVNKCYFTFSEEYTNQLVKKAIFVQGTATIEEPIINNECLIPSEVLNRGTFELRVYAYEVEEEELILRYSPTPTLVYVRAGSYIEGAESPEVITPSQFEQYMQALNDGLNEVANVNIDAEQLTNGSKITITDRTGTEKIVYVYDGVDGVDGKDATINGVNTLSIVAGQNIGLNQVGDTLTINNTYDDTQIINDITNLQSGLSNEILNRQNADNNLQSQIDAITVSSDVIDVVGTYQELVDYDTSHVKANDIIKVLQDSTHNGALSYYRWVIVNHIGSWEYVGSEGPFYTKSETDELLNAKQNEITSSNKLSADLVDDTNTTNKFITQSQANQIVTNQNNITNLQTNKQDKLTFDETPIENSTNPVTSGGIYTSQEEQNELIDYLSLYANALPKVTGTGTEVTLNDTAKCPMPMSLKPSATSQDGTPTPENPQDIHTVSGNNTIEIVGKNLFNKDNVIANTGLTSEGGTFSNNNYCITGYIKVSGNISMNIHNEVNDKTKRVCYYTSQTESSFIDVNQISNSKVLSFTTPSNCQYIRLQVEQVDKDNTMLEYGTTETSYLPYTKQTLPLNLPIENLFDKNSFTYDNYYYDDNGNLTEGTNTGRCTNYYKVNANSNYYISGFSTVGSDNDYSTVQRMYYFDSNKNFISRSASFNGQTKYGFITPVNCYYVSFQCVTRTSSTILKTVLADLDTIQLEKGTKANAYTPYGTTPIELCKIRNYEDYFYKNSDKWYLHKEIGKRVFNGSESWSLSGLSVSGYKGYYITSTFNEFENGFCNRFTKRPYSDWTGLVADNFFEFANNSLGIRVEETIASDVQAFKTWLSNNNLFIYGVEKTTPVDTEITDTTLINQLEAIYNKAISYQDQTNITQVNNDLPFVITASAIYDLSNLLN